MASNCGRAPPETQKAYLTNCLSTDFLAKLHFGDCATIKQALNVIDVDYKARNPLTVRRLLFYRCKQGKSEAFTDYVIRLEAAHREADVSSMVPEDIQALQMLGGCNDSELLKILLEVSPCVVEQLKQCEVIYESHKQTAGEIKGRGHRVSKVDSANKKNKYADLMCYKCYQKGHVSFKCTMDRSKLKCDYCKSTARHVSNDYCKKLNEGKGKDGKVVAKEVV